MESERVSPPSPADEDTSQCAGRASTNQLGAPSHHSARLETDGLEIQQPWNFLQQDFQDSNLSPALLLKPVNPEAEHTFTEYSLFQQSDNEFAPLRACPDISMASERFHFPPQECTTRGSLSQHPLAQDTILSEEGEKSCDSLSQHSFSPKDDGKQKGTVHSPLITNTDRQDVPSKDDTSNREKDSETVKDTHDRPVGEAADHETFCLTKTVSAQHLLKLLQKDVGVPSGSSSPISSASETSVKIAATLTKESKSTQACKAGIDQSNREGPTGEASPPQCQTQRPDRALQADQSPTLSSEICNITTGLRGAQPDESSDALHRELLSEVERHRSCEPESKDPQRKRPPPGQSLTPRHSDMSEGKAGVSRTTLGGVPWTKAFSAGLSRGHRERDLCSSGNRTGIDGSYLGFLPQSQSTPFFSGAPPKSTVKAKVGHFSAAESKKENQLSTRISPQAHAADVQHSDTAATTAKVQSLPSLGYMQKVDAWRANQASGKVQLFDSLALQGFSGISPKKKACDAVPDILDRSLSQQAGSLQQPPVLNAGNQDVARSSSSAPSSSSYSRRGEAVGRAPSDRGNTLSATKPSASPPGRSQSHSSLSTVVLVKKDQQTETHAEKERSQTQDTVPHQPSNAAPPSTLASLGHFSDVSSARDLEWSSSIGASSVVSLEVDNYAPHWTSKPSTPPPPLRTQELNIEERIPLYLQNLGIDQSPATILNPFAPKGPIREPEFSPTDLCTVKGSVGTPTRSTQPSEDGSPHKEEFSRSSMLSVASSISIPLSPDSLVPPTSIPKRTGPTLPSLETEAFQSERRLNAPSSLADEDSYPSTLQQQQRDSSLTSSQNTVGPGDRLDSDLSVTTEPRRLERDLESPLQTSRAAEQSAETSKGLLDIQKRLSQAESVVSVGSSGPRSASPAAPRLLSDEDVPLSLKRKPSRLQDSSSSSSSSSSTIGGHRTQPSSLWTRSSSESMLTSERLREISIGQESTTSSGQLYNTSTQSLITEESTSSHRRAGSTVGRAAAGPSFVLSQSARRAEPEGCSAATPDNTVPPQPPVTTSKPPPPPAVSTQQLTSTPPDMTGVPVEEKQSTLEGPVRSGSSSPVLEDTDRGATSDVSSESSLAVRVAKLLRSESPSTMVSSTPSITDQEESKAREGIKLKLSGQRCEPLELYKEDRRRIEEFKRELRFKMSTKSQGSTETGSSAASSVRVQTGQDQAQQTETFIALSNANSQPAHPRPDLSDTGVQLQYPPRPDLEAQIREMAAREGVALSWTNPRALATITIATSKRSTSPSPSTSPTPSVSPAPELLHLTDFSTGAVRHPKVDRRLLPTTDETSSEPACASEPRGRNQDLPSQSAPGDQKRRETVGGQFEEPPPQSLPSVTEDANTNEVVQPFRREDSVPGVGHDTEQAAGSSTPESPARIDHVHLTLSPNATGSSSASGVHSSRSDTVMALPREEFVPLRHSSSAATSPVEGVGLSSPPEWNDAREPIRQRCPERADTSTLFKTTLPQENTPSTSSRSLSPRHSTVVLPRLLNCGSAAMPVLLPYKPHGSEELFYMPQTEADSSAEPSDTTMESSHTGSDDAVPPPFSSEVLGRRDPGLDRGVTIRHAEGIYSKRLKTATVNMTEHRGVSESAAGGSQTNVTPAPKPSSQVSVAFTRGPLSRDHGASKRDRGTSPVPFLSQLEPIRESDLPEAAAQQSSSTLDQLWEKFCTQWSLEESRPTCDREGSLLERLERLSRLIHRSGGERRKHIGEVRRSVAGEAGGMERRDCGGGKVEGKPPVAHKAWRRRLQAEETPRPAEEDSFTSSISQRLGDELETVSTVSGSVSTVDTERLIRVFGAHRVQRLKSNSSLCKLYRSIDRQKDGREQRRAGHTEGMDPVSETTVTDESTVAGDSASSTSPRALPSHRGPSRTLEAQKAVQRVNKGIQAGDLELVCNGTRRHTRDVGTTFPSPGEAITSRRISSPSSSLERGWQRSPSKALGLHKQRKSRRSPPKARPPSISWFISAEELRSDARKENRPEEEEWKWSPSTTWFERYSRIRPWREPLGQRQVPEEGNEEPRFTHRPQPDLEARTKAVSSALTRMSLQEALEMRRPEFISQSRQRLRRLALHTEERKLQDVLRREREELFSQPGGPGRLPRPAGTALLRRAVPRKEMIQRSKQIYENLPEVQRRRQEERRKAEYRSYRLNAQFYNKRITSRVLGRRKAWQ